VAPVADAGEDFTVAKRTTVYLNGSAFDPEFEPLAYSWQQVPTSAVTVTLDDPTSPIPSFVAPSEPTDLLFTLVASDGVRTSDPDQVYVHVRNTQPQIAGLTVSRSRRARWTTSPLRSTRTIPTTIR
jgi:hypothetical protein